MKELKNRLSDKENLLEDQARRIDGLICELRSIKVKHEGYINRLRE